MLHETVTHTTVESTEATVLRIISGTQGRPADLIPILQQVQSEYRYLPEEALEQVARALGISSATVYGVATFYAQFSLEPKGKWVIRVCDGTACHVRGSQANLDALRKRFDLVNGASTTQDRMFSLEVVSCLGACGLAPVVVIDDKVHGQVTPDALSIILDHLIASEKANSDQAECGEVRAE